MCYFRLVISLMVAALWAAGCGSFSTFVPTPQGVSPTLQSSFDSLQMDGENNQLTPSPSPQVLTLWLTPELDPNNNSASSAILKARLLKFSEKFPGTQIRVRIKAATGSGGLMDMLTSTSAAAKLAMPSVIALSYQDMETAALKGLIHPINPLTTALDDNDWYPYAHQLALIQNNPFGLPFGGDTLLLVYRTDKVGITPSTWQNIFSFGQPILFSAADPEALLTLNLYLSAGGTIANDQGQPELLPDVLTKALNIYASGTHKGVFPLSLAQYEDDSQTWQAYTEQKANWLITHSSDYLTHLPPDSKAIPIPSLGSTPLSLATGWVWAISDPIPERRETSMRLAEFLSEPDFLAQWTPNLGLLPVRPSGLQAWNDPSTNQLINQLSLSARVIPSSDLMTSLGSALQQATLQVIKLQSNPLQAAGIASESLAVPPVK
jgi:multiple sugar transport system substrate-binding protein